MTEPFQLRRRTPAGRLRYVVDRLDSIDAQSSAQQATLIACRNLLADLAVELGTAEEVAEADSYAAMVNAPLRPETIAAIAERIKSGDLPVRKVRARVRNLGQEPAVLAIPDDELQPLLALADDPPPIREMTPEEWARLDAETAMSGVDAPGCDCGHEGLGVRWHASDCVWRKAQR